MNVTSAPAWSPKLSVSSRQSKEKQRDNLQTHRLNSHLRLTGSHRGKLTLCSSCRAARQTTVLDHELRKNQREDAGSCDVCWEECTGVITHWVMQERFGGNLCLVQCWALASFMHRLNTHSTACRYTQTHTHTDMEILPWGFYNCPQWMGGSQTHRDRPGYRT